MSIASTARLYWQCRRGMLELDLLLGRIRLQDLQSMTESNKATFARLLELPDPDLYACLMGQLVLDEEELQNFTDFLRTQYIHRTLI